MPCTVMTTGTAVMGVQCVVDKGVTTRLKVVVWLSGVPVTVIRKVPVGVDALVAMVRVGAQVGEQDDCTKVGVAPLGRPDALKLTAWVLPAVRVAVMVFEP